MKEYLWFVGTDTGYAGTEQYEVVLHEEVNDQDEDLGEMVWEMALEQAQSYGIERYCGCCESCEEENWEDCDNQEEGIEGYSELYIPEYHDKLRAGGGSFLEEYEGYKYDEELKAYYIEEVV